MNKTLVGHVSPETAYVVDNYPYGFRLRTQIRYWIETTKNGQRFVSQTMNPKTGAWNKPKASTYDDIKVLTLDESNGHIHSDSLRYNDDDAKIEAYAERHAEALTEREHKVIKHMKAHNAAMSKITWTVGRADPNEAHQTIEEQMAIINALTRVELAKAE